MHYRYSPYIPILILLILAFFSCTNIGNPTDTNPTTLTEIETSTVHEESKKSQIILPTISDVVKTVEPAVVSISVDILSRGIFYDFTDEGSGTGMIVRPNGYIVTNYHVIQDARDIEVGLSNGSYYSAEIVGLDLLSDLAVIKIGADQLPTIEFTERDDIRTGDWVATIGNALGLKGGPSVTLGIISGLGRTIRTDRGDLYDMIQTDAAINKGNSGGPLIDMDGKVIGINTAVYGGAQGVGFAVSSGVAKPIISSLIEKGKVIRPLIGLSGMTNNNELSDRFDLGTSEGILITQIAPEKPADNGGLKAGDVITALDGNQTNDMAEFLTLLWRYTVGETVKVDFISDQKPQTTTVTLIERPSP